LTFIQFAVIGLGTGAIYALLGQGIVLIYRSTGVVNFAQGATAALGGYVFYELVADHGWAPIAGILAAAVVTGALGALIQVAVMRPLRASSPLTRVIATTGVFTVLIQIGFLRYGATTVFIPPFLPSGTVSLGSNTTVDVARFVLLAIGVGITLPLWAFYRFTRFGLATSAVAENELTAGAMGISPDAVALVNWTVGSALAGVSGALISSIIALTPQSFSLLVVPALAAAMIGGFRSFPLTLLGGLLIGMLQAELTNYVTAPGWADSAGFLVIAVWMVIRGQPLPLRGHLLERLPRVGLPKRLVPGLIGGLVVAFAAIAIGSETTQSSIAVCAGYGLICLSLVVLTGYAGQISLAQFALAGLGALIAGRLSAAAHFSLLPALIGGMLAAMGAGLAVGLPALRTRGINLAIITLGLGVAFQEIVLGNQNFLGGASGTTVRSERLFGLDLDPVRYPARFAVMAVILLAVAMVVVANLRRGSLGRRMLAVRSNERAAAALGIDVRVVKLVAFVSSAALAGLGGVVLAFQNPVVQFGQFNVVASIGVLVQTAIAGVGYLQAAIIGGLGYPEGLLSQVMSQVGNASDYILLVSGLIFFPTLALAPDGIASKANPLRPVLRLVERRREARKAPAPAIPLPVRVPEAELAVDAVSVSFGGIAALRDVSMRVRSGEVVGLIGPNGAGKTTLLEVISGMVGHQGGSVVLRGRSIERWSAYRRARAGLGRSFQSLELFDDLTVRENLLVASDGRSARGHLLSVLRPRHDQLAPAALAAVHELGLEQLLESRPTELSAGQRRLVGIARAVAAAPSILLLDEPAAGLDPAETRELGAVVAELARRWGLGIVVVEHDFSLVQSVCDRLVVLDHGTLLADGPTQEVARRADVIAAFVGRRESHATGLPEAGER